MFLIDLENEPPLVFSILETLPRLAERGQAICAVRAAQMTECPKRMQLHPRRGAVRLHRRRKRMRDAEFEQPASTRRPAGL